MFLRVETDDERRDVDNLFANTATDGGSGMLMASWVWGGWNVPDVPLADEHAGVVNGLRQAALEDLSLETTLQEILDLQG